MNPFARKSVLNAGSGPVNASRLHAVFTPEKWAEVRLDIDPSAKPDLLSSFADMRGAVGDQRFDALFCSHAIEHLHAHEVIPAFGEFLRVLKPAGFALVTCPDLAAIASHLLAHGAESVAYQSPAGPIRPIDMLFGHSQSIADGRVSMAHKTGFTAQRLARTALAAGFGEVRVVEGQSFDLWAVLLAPGASIAETAAWFDGTDLADLFGAGGEASAAAPGKRFG